MIRVKIHDEDNNFLGVCPNRLNPAFMDELSGVGGGSFKLHVDDNMLERIPSLLAYDNLVHMEDEDTGKKYVWEIEAKKQTLISEGERAGRYWEVSGRGAVNLLGEGLVYPEYGVKRESDDRRAFTFASKRSQWYAASEWSVPEWVTLDNDISYRAGHPKDWPDKNARWMWPSSPIADQDDGKNGYFRLEFTLSSAKAFAIFCTADDRFVMWLDGDAILAGRNYRKVFRKRVHLAAGDHVIAIRAKNKNSNGTMRNMAGVLFSMFNLDSDGVKTSVKFRSAPGNGWRARPDMSEPPGWDAGDLMKVLMNEAQARNARGPLLISEGWTGGNDSLGNPWSKKHDRSIDIGTDLLTVLLQLSESHIDFRMNALLELQLYNHDYGIDRTTGANAVIIRPAKEIQEDTYEGDGSGVTTHVLIKTKDGWTTESSSNIGSKGRREGLLSLSNAQSDRAAQNIADKAFKDRSVTAVTTTIKIQSTTKVKPWNTFDIGDTVLAPINSIRDFEPVRCLSISAAEDDSNRVFYAVEVA